MRRLRRPVLAAATAVLLAGCGTAANASNPTWVPKQSFQGEGQPPGGPSTNAGEPGPGGPPTPGPRQPGPASPAPKGPDPYVVATKLSSPVGLAVLPDGTALVGERTTGRIVRVQPTAGEPVPTVRTLTGISTTAGGGLLDLALSPNYAQDNLIFAYLTTATDNRVVAFTLTGPVTPVLIGIPRGASDNTGRIAFGSDGLLYVGTGDAGQPALAADANSLAGKVLRVSDIGKPAAGNPAPASPIFTSGHRIVDGLCLVAEANKLIEVEAAGGATGRDNVNILSPGRSYGWPHSGASTPKPLTSLPAAQRGPGGCAVMAGQLYVTSLTGKALLVAPLLATGRGLAASKFTATLQNRYGRLMSVVADPAGGVLWLTTSNRDGHGRPVADDERVVRIPPPSGGGSSNSPA
jgi:glucose/arabinose dehydrogenase